MNEPTKMPLTSEEAEELTANVRMEQAINLTAKKAMEALTKQSQELVVRQNTWWHAVGKRLGINVTAGMYRAEIDDNGNAYIYAIDPAANDGGNSDA